METDASALLKEGERIDDLEFKGLRLIQDRRHFCFGTDSVLLADSVRAKPSERIIDIGSGTGFLATMIHAETGASTVGIELQTELYDMSVRSRALNGLDGVEFYNMDLRDAPERFGDGSFDAAVCNPPYFSGGISNSAATFTQSRHECTCDISDVARCCKRLVRYGGRLYTVYPTKGLFRLADALTGNGFKILRCRLVSSFENKPPYIALVEAKRGVGFSDTEWSCMTLYKPDGTYTDEARRIYGR